MPQHTPRKLHHTQAEEAEEDPEPGMLPVEPDDGSGAAGIPVDSEGEGDVNRPPA